MGLQFVQIMRRLLSSHSLSPEGGPHGIEGTFLMLTTICSHAISFICDLRTLRLGGDMNEANLQSTQYRRTVVLDIETVSLDPNLAKGALDALTGRIVCVGMLIDDGKILHEIAIAGEDEAQILTEFWGTIHPTDVIVGHNVHDFDLPFV